MNREQADIIIELLGKILEALSPKKKEVKTETKPKKTLLQKLKGK